LFDRDYSGQRVKKTYAGATTVYIGKLYECTGGTCTKYIFAGDNRIAMKTGSTVYYYHTDHLGSSSVMTDSLGAKHDEMYYYPYGKMRPDSYIDINPKHKFTGQELDGTGLYYYGARYYEPEIGRFISPDSIAQDFADPQTLNRYSYSYLSKINN
jgi:RHS repeat-associated protein